MDNTMYLHLIPGSHRYYCRVEDCSAYTWANVPFGYCPLHLQTNVCNNLSGPEESFARVNTNMPEKFAWPPVGYQAETQLSVGNLPKPQP